MQSADNITLSRLLTRVAEHKATDLYLSVGSLPLLRLEGKLVPLEDEETLTNSFLERVMLDALSEEQKSELFKEKDLIFSSTFNKSLRFKVNISHQKGNLSVVFRLIEPMPLSLEEAGLPEEIAGFLSNKKGLILVTGPYDSGKSTTAVSIINFINENLSRFVLTIEKPLEFIFTNKKSVVEQREVGVDTSSCAAALNFSLEENVEIIVLYDFSDFDTVKRGLAVIESGRLVIAMLNTSSAVDALRKIYTLFQASSQKWVRNILANNLLFAINQRLLPNLGGGRALAYELLVNNSVIRSLILNGHFDRINNFMRTAREAGSITLDQSLVKLVKDGRVKMEDAMSEAYDVDVFRNLFRE